MQIHQVTGAATSEKDPRLRTIVSDLISEAAPLAVHNRNYIVNNVPTDLPLETNGTIIASVLTKLFNTALRHTQNSVMLISAKVYGPVVLVQVKSKGNINPALTEDIGHASLKAQKAGGIIEMIQCENEQSSIAYCCLNVACQA